MLVLTLAGLPNASWDRIQFPETVSKLSRHKELMDCTSRSAKTKAPVITSHISEIVLALVYFIWMYAVIYVNDRRYSFINYGLVILRKKESEHKTGGR